jgi:hypothetical protein
VSRLGYHRTHTRCLPSFQQVLQALPVCAGSALYRCLESAGWLHVQQVRAELPPRRERTVTESIPVMRPNSACFGSIIAAIALRKQDPTGYPACTAAGLAGLGAWLRLLSYFRGFESTGVLVNTVLQISSDIKYFLVVLLAFVLGKAILSHACRLARPPLACANTPPVPALFGRLRAGFGNAFYMMAKPDLLRRGPGTQLKA